MLTALVCAPAGAADFRPFAPDSIWNLPLRDDAPLDPASADYVAWFAEHTRTNGVGINTSRCTMPLFWADADTPRQRVDIVKRYRDPALLAAWRSVPIPADFHPADCADANAAIAQRQPDGTVSTWEFWNLAQDAKGHWTAWAGGATDDVLRDRGAASTLQWINPDPRSYEDRWSRWEWNVTASGFPMSAGVITAEELARGRIDHALAVAIGSPAAGTWRWPAQSSDGGSSDPWAVPEGARLRLDPAVDVAKLPGAPIVRVLARAAQRHGIVVRDQTAAQTVFYTDGRPGRPVSVGPLLGGVPGYVALRRFPWEKLQLLDAPTCTTVMKECTVDSRVVVDVDRPRRGVVRLDTRNSPLNQPRSQTTWRITGGGRTVVRRCATCVRLRLRVPRGARRQVRVTIRTAKDWTVRGRVVVRGR